MSAFIHYAWAITSIKICVSNLFWLRDSSLQFKKTQNTKSYLKGRCNWYSEKYTHTVCYNVFGGIREG